MRSNNSSVTPKHIASQLAHLARDACDQIAQRQTSETVQHVRTAHQELPAMAHMHHQDETLVASLIQTCFYALMTGWVLDPGSPQCFDWRSLPAVLRLPFVQPLFAPVIEANPHKQLLPELANALDDAAFVLRGIDRAGFLRTFQTSQIVHYFYEPFLDAFDPVLRRQLGVWYTPPEIVHYMVSRVDTVLREELEIARGLADPRVLVFDPCCGTGGFLVEVIRHIATRHGSALSASGGAHQHDLRQVIRGRLWGLDILPAPLVIAHLQLHLLLQELAATGDECGDEEDVRLVLMSATALLAEHSSPPILTGAGSPLFTLPTHTCPVMVVLGNPPYHARSGPGREQQLVAAYKEGLRSTWGIKKYNLDDLYVSFFRLGERLVVEQAERGIVCYIANSSWISDPSFVVMRKQLLQSFQRFWIVNLHGNRKISEQAPHGGASESIFATEGFSCGIQQGVAISLWAKSPAYATSPPLVYFRDDINAAKAVERRRQLLASLYDATEKNAYQKVQPQPTSRYLFCPSTVAQDYLAWPSVTELSALAPINGMMEKRGGSLIASERASLEQRMRDYFDPSLTWEDYASRQSALTVPHAGFEPQTVRRRALQEAAYQPDRLVRYALRPFDMRWCYYTPLPVVWNRSRPTMWTHCWPGNRFLVTRRFAGKKAQGVPLYLSPYLVDSQLLGFASVLPFQRVTADGTAANLSPRAWEYLAMLGLADRLQVEDVLWFAVLALGYAPAYRAENSVALCQDWPHIPMPRSKELLLQLATLGKRIAALLNPDEAVVGVTTEPATLPYAAIATLAHTDGSVGEYAATQWGYPRKNNAIMPGPGKVVWRAYTVEEKSLLYDYCQGGAESSLGTSTCDIYLNEHVCWKNIPAHVWACTIGNYQVLKKWLSYRDVRVIGRPLTADELAAVSSIARRIAALLLLSPQLDAGYAAVKGEVFAWQP